jgi:hypothetical protein
VQEFFAHVRDVREFYAALVASGKVKMCTPWDGDSWRCIDERLQAAGIQNAVHRSAQAHALAGSLFSLLDWWIDKGMKADPREMDDLFHRMAWSGLAKSQTRADR